MADLALSMPYILDNEGGFTVDDGGPTMWGIVIPDLDEMYPGVKHTEADIKVLSKLSVVPIYRKLYWDKILGDKIVNQNIATCILDTAVNRGVVMGIKYAQRSCNFLGSHLTVDGIIGPKTIDAINGYAQASYVWHYESLEWAGYEAIIANNPAKYERYRHGWEARAKKLLTLA